MKIVVADIETTLIQPDGSTEKMWIFGGKDIQTGEVQRFEPFRGQEEIDRAIAWAETVDRWVGHNFIAFDAVQVNRHVKRGLIKPDSITDTLVEARTINFDWKIPPGGDTPHSLKTWGLRLRVHKGSFYDFNNYSPEMVAYWEQDLETSEVLYRYLSRWRDDPSWDKALLCEHQTQVDLVRQKYYGFQFNKREAEVLFHKVKEQQDTLTEEIRADFPPRLVKVKSLSYRIDKDGNEVQVIKQAREFYPMTQIIVDIDEFSEDCEEEDNGVLECYDWEEFNPGSTTQRIDILWAAGWKPFEKTKTHQKFSRMKVGDPYGKSVAKMDEEFYKAKAEYLAKYGWTCGEDNLSTLPPNAPEGAKKLAQWLCLEGRRSSLVEWINQVEDDGRIHGDTLHIGAWTGRGAHKNPNTANISSVWPEGKEPSSPVELIKATYDTKLRACWEVPSGSYLVGVDADGIQLRILADYLWRHFDRREYADAIVAGRKEDGTDIHNLNRKALGLSNVDRDDAKTFIYAWVLNAGLPKIASILHTTVPFANKAKSQFEASIPGLKPFKELLLPAICKKGWFKGYDGRKVIFPSPHHLLAGILQNGEAVVMKHARIKWRKELLADGIRHKPLTWVHDEWQTEALGGMEEAEHIKNTQIKSIEWAGKELGFLIPLAGSGSIGTNWANTH